MVGHARSLRVAALSGLVAAAVAVCASAGLPRLACGVLLLLRLSACRVTDAPIARAPEILQIALCPGLTLFQRRADYSLLIFHCRLLELKSSRLQGIIPERAGIEYKTGYR
jgi:hypothetical protein